jgi:hypothetical protein
MSCTLFPRPVVDEIYFSQFHDSAQVGLHIYSNQIVAYNKIVILEINMELSALKVNDFLKPVFGFKYAVAQISRKSTRLVYIPKDEYEYYV